MEWKQVVLGGALVLMGAAGARMLDGTPAQAQAPQQFRECFTARQESVDVGDDGRIPRPGPNRLIRVPEGWTPVGGGGGYTGNPTMGIAICR